jgi:hypothetical protein
MAKARIRELKSNLQAYKNVDFEKRLKELREKIEDLRGCL